MKLRNKLFVAVCLQLSTLIPQLSTLDVQLSTLSAQTRSEHEMQAIAANHLYGSKVRGVKSQPPQPRQLFKTDMVAAYGDAYNGTVFVSRDAIFAPVLGWTDRPVTRADENDGLQWWLETITATMQQKKADNVIATIQQAPQASDVQPLVTTRWAQETPYNDLCPVADSWTKRRAQTGCVATTMAQIMNYHEHPAKGHGMGYYTLNNKKTNKRIEGEYDWQNMRDTYSSSSTVKDETTEAVSVLMYDCGLASGMAYAVQGSGATSPNASRGLARNLDYDSLALHCSFRAFANDDQWLATIYGELAQQRPVLYMSTDDTYGAHAFVIDGCRAADGYLHVNWGWSGDADGWFDFFNLNPRTAYQQAYGMQGYDFSSDAMSQTAITGIMPPDGEERPFESYWCMDDEETLSVAGDSIVLQLPTLVNYHFLEFTGLVGLCIENLATGKSPIQPFYYSGWGEAPVPSLSGWNAMTIPYYKRVTDALDDGDYHLYLMSWYTKDIGRFDPQYVRFPARNDGKENYNIWHMTKKNGHLTISKTDVPVKDGIRDIDCSPFFGDKATSGAAGQNMNHCYDLQGRRTSHAQLYIKNGRKYISGK